MVRAKVKPVKAPAVEAVSQVKRVVYSLWVKDRFPSGLVKAFHLSEVAGISVVQDKTPEESVFKNPFETIEVGRV